MPWSQIQKRTRDRARQGNPDTPVHSTAAEGAVSHVDKHGASLTDAEQPGNTDTRSSASAVQPDGSEPQKGDEKGDMVYDGKMWQVKPGKGLKRHTPGEGYSRRDA